MKKLALLFLLGSFNIAYATNYVTTPRLQRELDQLKAEMFQAQQQVQMAQYNAQISALQADPRVHHLATDLMRKKYSSEQAFNIAISEAYQCIYGNSQKGKSICKPYGFWQ